MPSTMVSLAMLLLAASQVSAAGHTGGEHDHDGDHDDHAAEGPDDGHEGHDHAPGEHGKEDGHDDHGAEGPAGAPKSAMGHKDKAGGDHDDHDHGAEGPDDGHEGHDHAPGAFWRSASADQMCHWTYGKCTISKPYVAQRLGMPETWGMCTEKNVEDALHAEGWDCESDPEMEKGAMGCQNRQVLHRPPGGNAHNMQACMPGQVPQEPAMAQQYWDAHDEFELCLADEMKTAMQCANVTATSFMSQLEVIGRDAPQGMQEAIMAGLEQCNAATDMASCDAVEPAAETEAAMAAAATAAETTSATQSETPGVPAVEGAPDGALTMAATAAVAVAAMIAALM